MGYCRLTLVSLNAGVYTTVLVPQAQEFWMVALELLPRSSSLSLSHSQSSQLIFGGVMVSTVSAPGMCQDFHLYVFHLRTCVWFVDGVSFQYCIFRRTLTAVHFLLGNHSLL